MNIYLTGHTKPDLDSVATPIVYAEFLRKIKRYEDANLIPVLSGGINNETKYIFNEIGESVPKFFDEVSLEKQDRIILVDHNEQSQRHEKVSTEQIVEIIDHHSANINFATPIRIDIKPLGSSSTVVYEHFETYSIEPREVAQKLMLAAILSDTVGLKSSTTTPYDSRIAHELAEKLELDLKNFIFKIFKAKSDISGLSIEEIATKDYKILRVGNKKIFINQIETVEPQKVLNMTNDLVLALTTLKTKLNVDQTYCAVTDIININSHIIYATDEEKQFVEKAFDTQGKDNVADIGARVSRKKDIRPALQKVIS